MAGSSHPGKVIKFKARTKVGRFILIETDSEEDAEYIVVDKPYIADVTPEPPPAPPAP
jgi:hypothetical protein